MSELYEKVYKAKVWISIDTNKMSGSIIDAFVQMGAYNQIWPTETLQRTLDKMAKEGYYVPLKSTVFPRWATEELCESILFKHMSEIAGEAVFTLPMESYSSKLNRKVEKPEDFFRIFEDCLGMEDPLTLSRMFDLAKPKSLLYITHHGNSDVLAKIAENFLTVGDKSSMISVGKKPITEIVAEIEEALPKDIKGSGR
jgi:hypothetical protein